MTACPSDSQLDRWLAQQLPQEELAALGAHADGCKHCLERLARLCEEAPCVEDPDKPARGVGVGVGSAVPDSLWAQLKANPPRRVATPAGPSLPEGTMLGECRIKFLLGGGGMGEVYLAEQLRMKRLVAVKVVSAAFAQTPGALTRFRKEVETLAKLPPHAHVAAAFDAGDYLDRPYLIMEHVPGTDLGRMITEHGPLACDEACAILRQAAEGLAHLHQHAVVHRDLKPSNLIRTPEGPVKIIDLGLARLVASIGPDPDGSLHSALAIVGTLDYQAPEQALNPMEADARSDLYSLGCTFYCLLTGKPPFADRSPLEKIVAHASQAPTPLRQLCQDIPEPIAQVVHRLLAKKPEERYPSATALVADLDRATRPTWTPRTWMWWVAIVVGLVLLGVAGGAVGKRWSKASATSPDETASIRNFLGGRELHSEFPLKVRLVGGQEREPGEVTLRDGERFALEVELDREAYLEIWYLDENGRATQFLPNDFERTHRFTRGRHTIPSPRATYDFLVTASKGPEYLYVAASTLPMPVIQGTKQGGFRVVAAPEGRKRGGMVVPRDQSLALSETVIRIAQVLPRD